MFKMQNFISCATEPVELHSVLYVYFFLRYSINYNKNLMLAKAGFELRSPQMKIQHFITRATETAELTKALDMILLTVCF